MTKTNTVEIINVDKNQSDQVIAAVFGLAIRGAFDAGKISRETVNGIFRLASNITLMVEHSGDLDINSSELKDMFLAVYKGEA